MLASGSGTMFPKKKSPKKIKATPKGIVRTTANRNAAQEYLSQVMMPPVPYTNMFNPRAQLDRVRVNEYVPVQDIFDAGSRSVIPTLLSNSRYSSSGDSFIMSQMDSATDGAMTLGSPIVQQTLNFLSRLAR